MHNPPNGAGHVSFGGEGEIRTHEGLAPLPVFKTGAFNRSATSPSHSGRILDHRLHQEPQQVAQRHHQQQERKHGCEGRHRVGNGRLERDRQ
jgi:hypothetical protein